jgi:hypothetical protein
METHISLRIAGSDLLNADENDWKLVEIVRNTTKHRSSHRHRLTRQIAMRLLLPLLTALHLLAPFLPIRADEHHGIHGGAYQTTIEDSALSVNGIPFSTRAYWMRRANSVLADLSSPCPFAAFATVIVNHTETGLGHEVCIGINSNSITGNPTLHGQLFKSVKIISDHC